MTDHPQARRDLAVQLEWDGTLTLYEYATRLAELNNMSRTRLLGRYFQPPQWRGAVEDLLAALSTASGVPIEVLRQTTPRARHRRSVRVHDLTGPLHRSGHDGRILLDALPAEDPRAARIIHQVNDPNVVPNPRRQLDEVADLGEVILPLLSQDWPTHEVHDDNQRRDLLLADATRTRPLSEWSAAVREYVLLTLWNAAYLGPRRGTSSYTTFSMDLSIIGYCEAAADDIEAESPRLAEALRALKHQVTFDQGFDTNHRSDLPRIGSAPGPLSVARILAWSPETTTLIDWIAHALTADSWIAFHSCEWTFRRYWEDVEATDDPHVDRLLTVLTSSRPGHQILMAVNDLAHRAAPWTTPYELFRHQSLQWQTADPLARAARIPVTTAMSILDLDLAGYLTTAGLSQFIETLRRLDPQVLLEAREHLHAAMTCTDMLPVDDQQATSIEGLA